MLELRGVGYRYPSASAPAVQGVDLAVAPGEVVLLTGPTGCGKSTVLRLAAGLTGRHGGGEVSGTVGAGGRDPSTTPPRERVAVLGFVSQNPERQVITGRIGDELAFGPESAGWDAPAIAARVAELPAEVGLPYGLDRSTSALSGGERQRLVVGAALAAGATILLLDEPLAHLDPPGAEALVALLRRIADDGVAVLIVEHRLEAVLPAADRVVVMDAGRVVSRFAASAPDLPRLRDLGLRVPGLLDLRDRVGDAVPAVPPARPARPPGEVVLAATDLTWTYPGAAAPALASVTAELRRGETVALLGGNGAGKSTLLAALTSDGPGVAQSGRVVRIPQDPDLALFCETVREELEYGPREARRDAVALAARAAAALSLEGLEERAPQALSRGQRLRTAVAAALTCEPDVLVLDEPTSGQDHDQVERMMDALASDERALLFATHDVDLALRHADRVWILDAGRLVLDATPQDALAAWDHGPLPPLVAWCRARGLPPMTAAEVQAAVRGA